MQTRQELILDFMKAMLANDKTIDMATNGILPEQKAYARDVYLMAAILADRYLETI